MAGEPMSSSRFTSSAATEVSMPMIPFAKYGLFAGGFEAFPH